MRDTNDQLSAQLQAVSTQQDARSMSPTLQLQTAPSTNLLRASSTIDLLGNTPAENQKLRRALRDYESKLDKSESAREELKREVQRLHKQIIGYRQSTQTQNYVRLEKEEKRLKETASELKKRAIESEAELLRTRGTLKEREALIEQMKEEYAKLFSAIQKQKTASTTNQSSPSKLTRVASCASFGTSIVHTSNHARGADAESQENTLGSSGKPKGMTGANDNPYLLNLYRSKIAELERNADGLQIQIRKMIASEYRHKQQNRLFRVEKKQLVNTCDQLRSDFEKAVLMSAKTMTTTNALGSSEAKTTESEPSRVVPANKALRPSSSGALHEVKRLRQRNQFLEERFRTVLQAAGRSSRTRNVASDQGASNNESPTDAEGSKCNSPTIEVESNNRGSLTTNDAGSDNFLKTEVDSTLSRRGSSANFDPLAISRETFASIDVDTLHSLQNVKHIARVRPHSAAVARR